MDRKNRQLLLQIAADSIDHGLRLGQPLTVDPAQFGAQLQETGASFVTLHIEGNLRGCIGSLEGYRPLVVDVAQNAFAAAFRDPRFGPLTVGEREQTDLSISVLTPPEPLVFGTEQQLIEQLRPGVDGLILEDGPHRGTFLPAVWDQLPQPTDFVAHLKRKSGLPADYWSDSITVQRYTTETIS